MGWRISGGGNQNKHASSKKIFPSPGGEPETTAAVDHTEAVEQARDTTERIQSMLDHLAAEKAKASNGRDDPDLP